MSKCQISIAFEKPDRTYFGGEAVRGRVRVVVQEETKGNGIKLTHFWRTHGRGNVDTGPAEVILLAGPQVLLAGDQLEFPFEVNSPTHPVTYRGHLIYVDHYIKVDVDVPWARNPSSEEEYILRPGKPPAQMTGQRDQLVSLAAPAAAGFGWPTKIILGVLATILLVVLASVALVLVPVILVVAAFVWIRNRAVASRTGIVELQIPHKIAAPGEQFPVSLRFTPRKSFLINSISLQITGVESAASGSGSDKKTHTHPVVTHRHVIREGGLLLAGETIDEHVTIVFPDTKAFSFQASDNSIKWSAEVRVDIPKFPDWSKSEPLQIVPIEYLGEQAMLANGSTGPAQTSFDGNGVSWNAGDGLTDNTDNTDNTESEPTDDIPAMDDFGVATPESAAAGETSVVTNIPTTMQELLSCLNEVGRNHSLRTQIITNAAGAVFDVSVVVDRIVASVGILGSDSFFSNGKTITGTIEGTQQAIEILAPETLNSELEGFRRGDKWQGAVTVISWDSLYSRLRANLALSE